MKLEENETLRLEKLRAHLAECTVLLRSDGSFPLEKPGEIALFGSGARRTIKGGTGSGEVNSRYFVTVEQGLKDAGFQITSSAWLDSYDGIVKDSHRRFVEEIKERAERHHTSPVIEGLGAIMPEPEYELPLGAGGDTAIYVLSRISGEGSDRDFISGDIKRTQSERRDILALHRQYARFMLILNVGGPVDLGEVAEVENILVLSQLGVETGAVVADLLLGKSYPSGKLTTTWASADTCPAVGEFGDPHDTRYREGVYVGYRYFDTAKVSPLFPFGFGLGYTQFHLSGEDFSASGETVTVKTTVKNVGCRPGKEVVQLYVSSPAGEMDKPYQALAAFAKTDELQPGEEQEVSLSFLLSDLASYHTKIASYLLEEGNYLLRLGTSSRQTKCIGCLCLPETVTVEKVENRLGTPDFTDWIPPVREEEKPVADHKRIEIDPAAVSIRSAKPHTEPPVPPQIGNLSDEELVYLSVGAFEPEDGMRSVIGNAGTSVAGAAGETTGRLKERGIPTLVMADGPAGLRLARDYIQDEEGIHVLGASMPESMLEFLPEPVRLMIEQSARKPKQGETVLHQYCTALPIGTALAQSWNLEFARLCGDIVGEEMECTGVQLWLAPALNIHRSIRCGRNFEYYSEDPLISGAFAAAITQGVQAHPGCSTTIKHFAANNQETNRHNSNSLVSERAMREIYLRGFEICVRESQPCAVMTSYNLINGVHTSERRDLIEDILRGEFGYRGIVMTDWVVKAGMADDPSAYPAPEAWKVAAAGGDLFMPGGKEEYENVLDALRTGKICREQLCENAARVYRMALCLRR